MLDTAWTATPGSRGDVESVRPRVAAVLRSVDLFHASLELLDDWVARADVVDGLVVDGVAWWFHLRPFLVDFVHERLLWAQLVAGELPPGLREVEITEADRALLDVLAAWSRGAGPSLSIAGMAQPALGDVLQPHTPARGRSPLSRWRRWRDHREHDRRATIIAARADALGRTGGHLLAITQPRIHQIVRTLEGPARRIDPQLDPIVAAADRQGISTASIALGLDHRRDDDWSLVRDDDRILPQSIVTLRRSGSPGTSIRPVDLSAVVARANGTPCFAAGIDLGPVLAEELARYASAWLPGQRTLRLRAARLIEEMRPRGLLVNHEGIRTPWLAAALDAGVPVFAMQHGLIYPRHAVYAHARHPAWPYPTRMFTFGEYERRVLIHHGGYAPHEVVAVGSPRFGGTSISDAATRREIRANIRRQLGIREGDRLLVVSTAHTPLFRRFHLAHMIAELLADPLPGVHVVFKLHPGEADEGPYRALVEGLARAAGHQAPSMIAVRDIDLYELLQAADAHLGLHSTVLTDAVVAGTPNLVAVVEAYRDLIGYVEAGVATPVTTAADIRAALASPPVYEPDRRRAFVEDHFAEGDAARAVIHHLGRVVASPPSRDSRPS